MTDVLDTKARTVADAVLAEEEQRRHHLVVALSGAHAYGFPSPDSDLDLKAIHVAQTRSLLGLTEPIPTSDRAGFVGGIEIDYTSNELAGVLRGLLKGNGNYLERVLGKHLLLADKPLLEELAALMPGTLSKKFARHYQGFAMQQRSEFVQGPQTAKKVLYVLRTALTGAQLLRSGELRVDLTENLAEYGFEDARELIERKKSGERTLLDAATAEHWLKRVDGAFEALKRAEEESGLPEVARNAEQLDRWLVDVRMRVSHS
jgi:predicted nucleotidyltransferase